MLLDGLELGLTDQGTVGEDPESGPVVHGEQPIGDLLVVIVAQMQGSLTRPGVGDDTVRLGDYVPSQGELHDVFPRLVVHGSERQ